MVEIGKKMCTVAPHDYVIVYKVDIAKKPVFFLTGVICYNNVEIGTLQFNLSFSGFAILDNL